MAPQFIRKLGGAKRRAETPSERGRLLVLYFSQIFDTIGFKDVIPATIKTFFFGFAIGIVGSYKGYNADKGTESVGIAANTSVVISSLLVIILDMIAVQITNILF